LFCAPLNGFIGSKEILEILNENFEGEVVTSDQATLEIMRQLPRKYKC